MLNLDCVSESELRELVAEIGQGVRPIRAARKVFGTSGDGRTQAIKNYRAYAWNKITAIVCRSEGKIDAALMYESICERIYKELPEFAKW